VIEVERGPEALRDLGRAPAPRAIADLLVPGLEVVEGPCEQIRVRRPEHQVIHLRLRHPLLDPFALLLIEDLALPRL
jgi:hypothetical protein